MNIVEINTCAYGSTGRIMTQIAQEASRLGNSVKICIPNGRHNTEKISYDTIWIGNRFSEDLHIGLGRLSGFQGCFSIISTLRFVKKLKEYKPDIIHIHNLHNSYINLPILFKYIKEYNIPIVWTLHDCWAFTAKCPHFSFEKCEKWKTGCERCIKYKSYPQAYIDQTKFLWKMKKKYFTGINNCTIVTPSEWLGGLVRESFLSQYDVQTINNGIDLSVFYPIINDFKNKYNCGDKKIILSVAFGWGYKKGLDTMIKIANELDSDKYTVVLVGTDEIIEEEIPPTVLTIRKTNNQRELAEIYTAADVFVNPTREDNYPTTNMEALACGTPVVTYDVGGCSETIDSTCGIVVKNDSFRDLIDAITAVVDDGIIDSDSCVKYAIQNHNKGNAFTQYVELYRRILLERTR